MYGLAGSCSPAMVNGSPTITACFTYDDVNNLGVYQIAGSQVQGQAVQIYDPSGTRPTVTILPGDNAVAALNAASIPLQASDNGASYRYGQLLLQNWSPSVSSGQTTQAQLEAQVVKQMQAEGWSSSDLSPWLNQLSAGGPSVNTGGAGANASGATGSEYLPWTNPAPQTQSYQSYPVNSGGTGTSSTPAASVPVVNSAGAAPLPTPAPTPAVATTDWTAWFTKTSVGSIPNWALVTGAAVLLFGFSGGGGRR